MVAPHRNVLFPAVQKSVEIDRVRSMFGLGFKLCKTVQTPTRHFESTLNKFLIMRALS